ncbi:helix-turn-helix domain-containing protein [Streptomyces sp. NPDC002845]
MAIHVAPGEEAASGLDRRAELKEFLRSRRARLKPEDLGLPSYGRRRVPGLRREELAQLAGVSFAYYTRLEQGYGDNMSPEVLDAVAQALRLNEDERAHLVRLAQPGRQGATQEDSPPQRLRPAVRHLLDSLGVPAYVAGRRMDILGWNRLAAALFGDWAQLSPGERNWPRLILLSPRTRDRFADPGVMAQSILSVLRMDAGAHPDDPQLACLIKELSEKSEEFRRLWARHDVRCKSYGTLRMRHPLVGEFDVCQETMSLPDDTVQLLVTFHAEPGSRSEKALRTLADWGTEPRH